MLFNRIAPRYNHNIVGEAYNGKEAIELISSLEQKPEIVLMDHRMPIKDGLEATKELLDLFPELTIVFVSADDSVKSIALGLGAKLFINKPYNTILLFAAIKNLISNQARFSCES